MELSQMRKDNNISQTKMAEFLGVTSGAVSHYEQGVRFPRFSVLELWAKTFGYTVEIILKKK